MIYNLKDFENRNRYTSFSGEVLIHASLTPDSKAYDIIREIDYNVFSWIIDHTPLPLGYIIGKMTFGKYTTTSNSKWFFGIGGYPASNGILFKNPIPYKGQLSFPFEVPNNLIIE
jgi:hypothetical protein